MSYPNNIKPLKILVDKESERFARNSHRTTFMKGAKLKHWVPGVKRVGREADRSPPTSAEVKNTSIYTSAPPQDFMA
jgi:hypothetical protein